MFSIRFYIVFIWFYFVVHAFGRLGRFFRMSHFFNLNIRPEIWTHLNPNWFQLGANLTSIWAILVPFWLQLESNLQPFWLMDGSNSESSLSSSSKDSRYGDKSRKRPMHTTRRVLCIEQTEDTKYGNTSTHRHHNVYHAWYTHPGEYCAPNKWRVLDMETHPKRERNQRCQGFFMYDESSWLWR